MNARGLEPDEQYPGRRPLATSASGSPVQFRFDRGEIGALGLDSAAAGTATIPVGNGSVDLLRDLLPEPADAGQSRRNYFAGVMSM